MNQSLQNSRKLFAKPASWAVHHECFEWHVPEAFNIAVSCSNAWAKADPDRIALIEVDEDGREERWTAGALSEASDRYAQVLRECGVKRGDRVAALLPQGAAVLISHLAAMKLGAIALPLFTLFGPDALAFRLADSGATVLLTDKENLPKIKQIESEVPNLQHIFVTNGSGARAFWAEIEAADPISSPERTNSDDPAVMIYTSGTTGPPKGVLHGHRFLFGHLPSVELTHHGFPKAGDVGWTPADWAWIGGLMDLAIPCLYFGVPLIAHRMRKFSAQDAFQLIKRFRVTTLFLPPTALRQMAQVEVPKDLALRSISSGGEVLGADLLQWGRKGLGVEIAEIYGQTECNLSVAAVRPLMDAPLGTMGLPVPGFDLKVMRPDGAETDPGEVGEIAVRKGTPSMFLKYWGQPEKTAAKWQGEWMRTGDLASRDRDGFLTFHARDDDVITSSGYRIGPSEIETCLNSHDDVLMSAVVGLPDPKRTEAVTAFVVPKQEGSPALAAELIQRVKDRISPHLAPRALYFRDSLPMTATGKIMRRALRDEAAG